MKTKFLNITLTACVLGLAAGALAQPTPVRASTYTVNTTDDNDDGTCNTRHCSLREAIHMANSHAGPDVVSFNIPGASPHTIRLLETLPALLDDSTTIAGDTQPGYSADLHYSSGLRSRGRPAIVLDAALMFGDHILEIPCNDNIIRNLSWVNFANGYDHRAVDITGSNNLIEGNFFGFYPDGRLGDSNDVIRLWGMNNLIKDNVLWGRKSGIEVWSGNGHVIQGNLIGTDPTGNSDANAAVVEDYGIITTYNPSDLLIGGMEPADRNVISGYSNGEGIEVGFGVRIINNYIGTNADGNAAIPNQLGIDLHYQYCQSLSPGSCSAAPTIVQGNLISANNIGIVADAEGSIIQGNRIGTDAAGTTSLGYQENGVSSDNVRRVVIGGRNPGDGNLISGNRTGIYLRRYAEGIEVYGNQIGTDLSGTAAIPNNIGIKSESTGAIIGSPGAGNVISGNTIGLWVTGRENRVWANRIGTNAAGTRALPNYEGIRADGGYDLDLAISDENLIAFNTSYGIHLISTIHVAIMQNLIHHNGADGIYLDQSGITDPRNNWIRENSIYSNGIRGIRFALDGLNDGVEPPVFTRVTTTSADGTACPNCHIEIFVSDRDSSGFGEGKTFILAVDADSDGTFHADIDWRFRNCDSITATATDSGLNTSEFSRDAGVVMCAMPTQLVAWVWVLGGAGGGGALLIVIDFLLRRRRHLGPGRPIGLGLLGGILGAGIGIGLLAMPFVQIRWPQGQQGGEVPPAGSACRQFMEEALIQPADGAVFSPGTDVRFELSPQPDPPGSQSRWILEVTDPDQTTVRKELVSNSISLSELGFDPKRTGIYLWTLIGERSETGANIWKPLCRDISRRVFQLATPQPVRSTETATVTPSATNTQTDTPTVTETQSLPTATLRQNANCRRGPGTEYDIVTNLPQGLNAPIVGRNENRSWWQVQAPGGQVRCWLALEMVQTAGDLGQVPVVEAEPLGCWVKPQQGPNKCISPCPKDAQPGGACTP